MAGSLGDRIRDARIRAGMTQEDAALEAGISVVTWSHLETDRVDDPLLSTVCRIAITLGVTLESLVDPRHRR